MSERRTLVLRLAGPLQAWGTSSQFNRRETQDRPSKSGVVGLLAAAQGRARGEDLTDLLGLQMAVRVDQAGTLLRDYHTVSDQTGQPLLATKTNARGRQVRTSPKKMTHVTQRFYLQDAVFVALINGDTTLVESLVDAVRHPKFHLFLGRRNCPPSDPLVVEGPTGALWAGDLEGLLSVVPWQAGQVGKKRQVDNVVSLAATLETPDGDDVVSDVPLNFAHDSRAFAARRVRHLWVRLPVEGHQRRGSSHDPFALLGGE